VETLIGVFRTTLPARYWHENRSGAIISIFLTLVAGVSVGLRGLLDYAGRASEQAAKMMLQGGVPGAAGADQSTQMIAAMQSPVLAALAFLLFTPTGWLADYLVLSAVFRTLTLAADNPWGDPFLEGLDHLVRDKRDLIRAKQAADAREKAEGPEVPDRVLECRKFAGKEADYVVVASRRKPGWTLATTVVADSVRLRIGDPREITIEGWLRTCYPLRIIRDIQVDRRIVHYEWPKDMPPLPGLDTDSGVWSPPKPSPEE
jgi:hypothetical protein